VLRRDGPGARPAFATLGNRASRQQPLGARCSSGARPSSARKRRLVKGAAGISPHVGYRPLLVFVQLSSERALAGACHCCSSRGAAAWTCAFAARPRAGAQELAAGALARVKAGVVCCPGCRPLIGHSSGGCCGTRGAASTGKGARMQAECPQGVPFRMQHPLGVVINRPSVWPDR
jgi:hypothetical protein